MSRSEAKAREVIKRLRISEAADLLLLREIARELGASVRVEAMDGADARIIMSPTSASIVVDSHATPTRQRFSIAHELGHLVLHRQIAGAICNPSENGWFPAIKARMREREADQFAAALLLPKDLCSELVNESPSFELFDSVAARFRTSLSTTVYRYLELTDEACAVVWCVDGQAIQWTRNSVFDDLEIRVETPTSIGSSSIVSQYFRSGCGGQETADTPIAAWARTAYRSDAELREFMWPMPSLRGALVLLWVETAPELNEDDDEPTFR